MSKTLVLAEKPSVGREIARVMNCCNNCGGYIEGDKYVVTWALGHLITLADPEEYDKKYEKWDILDLPMLPVEMRLTVIKESAKQFGVIRELMKRADLTNMVIATDSGREGELVARWIMQKAGWKKPTKRLWISSQTDKAIREGFQNLRPASDYDNLFRSAQARSEADWLVGLNVTRALTCRFNAQLSAGRVQTPTLALITAREEEIRSFKPKDYWGVSIRLEGFNAVWRDAKNQSRTFDKAVAESVAAKVSGKSGVITSVSRTYKSTPPPPAYDLTELQRDANKKYAYSAKETLSLMQSLYERHKLLTYPRTDSRYIPQDVAATLPDRLRAVASGQYRELTREILAKRPLQTRFIVNDAKVTDHHAIIPTEESPDYGSLSGPEKNIYDLVVRRFLALFLPVYEYEELSLIFTAERETFTARGRTTKEAGWKRVYGSMLPEDDEDEVDEKEQALPELRQGERLPVLSAVVTSGKTMPPGRYTEAKLLYAMEHPTQQVSDRALGKILEQTSGLGTPATRADIIEKLFSSFYIERRGKELVPTSKGKQLINLVPEELRSAELTAKWEERLARIAAGKENDRVFVAEMKQYATKLVNAVKLSDAAYVHDNQTREACPDCGKFLLRVKGKQGEMLVCPDRTCGYRRNLTQTTNARCPNCHKKLELRGNGEDSIFACVCGYREKLSAFKERRAQTGAGKAEVHRYLEKQRAAPESGGGEMAAQLAKWMAKKDKE